jgi:hypothetical protein
MRQWFPKAALSLTVTLGGLGFAKLVARRTYGEGFRMVVDPYEDHAYRPLLDYDQAWAGRMIRFYTNSLGWKADRPGVEVQKRSALTRVVFLGDSFAEGVGCPQEETASGIAERALNRGGRRFEVLNGGRASYSPLLEYQRLKRFYRGGYEADVVVVFFDLSDLQDEISYTRRYRFAPDGEPERFAGLRYQPFLRAFYNQSALVRSLRRAAGNRIEAPPGSADLAEELRQEASPMSVERMLTLSPAAFNTVRSNWVGHAPSLAGWVQEGFRLSFESLLRIERLTKAHGSRLYVVVYPWPQLLYQREDPAYLATLERKFPRWFAYRRALLGTRPAPTVSAYRSRAVDFCHRAGIEVIDLFPDFERNAEWHRLFLAGDVHWNEAGSRLAGERIAAAIRKDGK